ncbi:integrin alpha-3-like isoform X4 [Hippoglossus hippoglossus]|uniref:integrin alpha-3-like isoform X4 n=1 Tax=Hippoglossus hippoglossus TaxID=8267 RepID=UPI00148C6834|nr:integrin alpha-3-like isoform X4 [Hippoglossus hippoglossus]
MLLSSSQVCVSMALGDYAFLAVYISVCVTFNLDTSFPLLKTGGDGSLFGLSVALHQDLKTDTYLLLVGAPREKAEPDVLANRTGGVYSCPISMDQSDCSRMKLIHPDVNPSEDLIEDMWLGVSVASQVRPGGRVLACGHRFVKLYGPLEVRQMIGRCYLLGNDLQFNESDMNWQKPDQPCSHLGDVRAEVMCNAGISASITQTEVIVGSPGSYEWQDDVTIVTGAPKDSKDDARGSVLLVVKQNNELVVQQTLRGEQTGSYFGNAVATTDLNNDGWNDLLVGAPFYFHREQEAGGAVYVYMNSGGGFNSGPSVVLRGPAQSAFGMTVAAAGDLNQDGFQDFAVGAPFSETGSVMIWTGSSEGVSTEPSQVIRGSSVAPRFRTFGFSLSAGVDVDGNKYPDLVVGSLDDTVALLRTRPVIHLNKTLRISPDIVDPDICDFCIEVEVCFSYIFSTGEKNDRDNITVHFAVAADVTSLKPRLRFHENRQSTYSGYLTMPKTRCDSLRVGLLSPIRDKLQPLVFSLNVSLYEKPPKKRSVFQDLKLLPVLSHTPQPIRTQIHIQKACGSDNRCHSNLQMTAQFTDENQKPLSMKKNKQVLNYNSGINRLFLEVNVSNTPSQGRQAEDAHNAILNISIPPSLIYSGIRTKAVKADVTAAECSVHHTVLQCELGNPFKSNHKVQLFIIFQTSDISLETTEIQTLLQLSTLSEQHLSPVSVSMLVEYSLQTSLTLISSPGPASFSGHVIGESATKKTEDVGSLLLFTFQVHVNGKPLGHQGNLEVEFNWPSVLSNGKWLLYLTEIRVHGTSEPRCNPPDDIINPLNLVLPMEKRKGRGLEEEMRGRGLEEEAEEKRGRGQEEEKKKSDKSPPILHLHQQKRKSYTLDCVHGAKCVTFVCPLINMKNSATLSVRARIWNSTMIEDYSDARSVLVRGRATLKLRTNKHTINIGSQSTEIEVHIYPDLGQQVDSSAPLLIIGVSMVAGVLLLALICLVLWKCGFFRRASTRELYEAKSQTAHVKRPESEHERLSKEL